MKRWTVVTLIIVMVAVGAALAARKHYMPYDLQAELAAARAQGIPTSFKEMQLPPIPPGQDAAPDYAKAWDVLHRHDFSRHEHVLLDKLTARKAVTRGETAELRRIMSAHADYVNAINAGAAKPHWALPWQDTPEAEPFRNLSHARQTATTLRNEGALLVLEGHPIQAARIQALGYNVGQQMYEQPTVLPLLVGGAIDGITAAGLTATLTEFPPNSEVAHIVRDAAGKDLEVRDVHRALLGEVSATAKYLQRSIRFTDDWKRRSFIDRLQRRSQLAAVIRWKVRMIRASETPEPLRLAALQGVADELARLSASNPAYESAMDTAGLGGGIEETCLHQAAQRRTLYAAARVLEYRARTGRYPARLEDAVKPTPLDPFDQKPLSYKRTANGFEVVPVTAGANYAAKALAGHRRDMVFAYPAP